MKFSLPLRVKDKIGALHNFCLTLNSNFAFSLQSKTSRSFDVAFVGIIKAFDAVWSNMLTKNLQEELFTHKEEMDLETAQTTTTAKLPILKQGEYDMWRLRIEQYLSSLVTTKEKAQKKNDVKARSMLLMALPNEHLMTFNYAPSTKSLNSIFNRLQKIVSQLAILGENISQEDLNLKFLRSLPSEWNTHVVVWRNKPDLDTMSFDNLYDNFKLLNKRLKELQAQAQAQILRIWLLCHLLAVLIKLILLMELVPTIHFIQPNGSQLVYEDLEQIHEDDIEEMDLKWQLALLSMRTIWFFWKTGRKITINGSDTAGYDKSKVECFNCHKMGHFARECRGPRNQDSRNKNQDSSRRTINVEETSFKAMVAIDGAATNKEVASVGSTIVLYQKELRVFFCEQLAILKRDISYKDSELSMLKSELEKLKQEKESNQLKIENFDNASKSLDKLIGSQIIDKSRKGLGFVSYSDVPPPPIGLFSPPNLDLPNSGLEEFQQPEFEGYGPKTSKNVSEDTSNEVGVR
ncbi:ribonuclease H-like domain-containing protein [Tanacetum coccineum]